MEHSGRYTDVPAREVYFHMPGLIPRRPTPTSLIYVPSPYRAGQTLLRSKCRAYGQKLCCLICLVTSLAIAACSIMSSGTGI